MGEMWRRGRKGGINMIPWKSREQKKLLVQ